MLLRGGHRPHLSPQTLTRTEQNALLRVTRRNLRDHLIYSLALGTGLRLVEIVDLNVGHVYTTDGKPKNRVRLRPETARNGRAGDVFLPDVLLVKFRRFWRNSNGERLHLRPDAGFVKRQPRSLTTRRRGGWGD